MTNQMFWKKIGSVLLALCLLWAAACSRQPTWQEQYDLGMRYLSESNYEQAIVAFTAAIDVDPSQALAYVGRADAYVGWGETVGEKYLTQAQTDYEQALALDDSVADVYLRLSELYIQQGENEKAFDLLLRGYEITGDERLYQESEPSVRQKFIEGYFFQTFDSLPESGQQALHEAIAALQRGDLDELDDLLEDSGIPALLYTETDGYLIRAVNGIEIRPEQGTGYSYVWYDYGELGNVKLYSRFACSGWQCNGPWYYKGEENKSVMILAPNPYDAGTNEKIIEGFGTIRYYTEASGIATDNKGIADSQQIRIESPTGGWNEYRAENGFVVEFSMDSINSEVLDSDLGSDPNSVVGSAVDMYIFERAEW